MGIIGAMVMAAFVAWLLTKANCMGNVFGCLIFIILTAAIAAVLGIST